MPSWTPVCTCCQPVAPSAGVKECTRLQATTPYAAQRKPLLPLAFMAKTGSCSPLPVCDRFPFNGLCSGPDLHCLTGLQKTQR